MTEAVLDRTLLAGGKGLSNSIDINDEDHPTAGQVMGSEPAEMAAAAGILAEATYDVIDLNFACPVKKVKNKARGGWMLADTARGIAILRAVRDRLPHHPLSLSLRRGFDDSAESEERFWQLCEAARELGYIAVRVHGRTVEQKYAGRSRRPFLKEVKDRYPDWFVWGSGDVFDAEDVVDMLRETGVDGVWIARGAIGNPWIFRDAARLIHHGGTHHGEHGEHGGQREGSWIRGRGQVDPAGHARTTGTHSFASSVSSVLSVVIPPPTVAEQRQALVEHFDEAMAIHGEQLAGRRMRKIGIKYARFHPEAAAVKKRFVEVRSLDTWRAVIDDFYAHDGPGVRPGREVVDEVNESCEIA